MKPKNLTLAVWLAMASVCVLHANPKIEKPVADVKSSLESSLASFLKKKDFSFQSFNVSGNSAEGTAQFLDSQASFSLTFSDESHFTTLTVNFNTPKDLDRGDSRRLAGSNLSDWWPKGTPEPKATAIICEFGNSLTVSELKMIMQSSSWSPISGSPLQVSNPSFTVSVRDPASRRPSVAVSTAGELNLGGAKVLIAAAISSSGQDWAFSGKVPSIILGTILKSAINDPILNEIPNEISSLSLTDLDFSVQPGAQRFSASGTTDVGRVEFDIKPAPNKGPLSLLLGFRLPSGFQLSKIASSLQPLDNMGLQNTQFFLSSVQQMPALKSIQATKEVNRGLTMMASYNLSSLSPEFASWLGQTDLNVVSTVSNRASDAYLSAYISTSIPFDKSGNVTMKEINLTIRPAPALKVDMGASIDVKTSNGTVLQFKSDIEVDIPNLAIGVKGQLKGVWNNPFGISNGLTISDLGLGISASIKSGGIPLPALALQGTMKAGNGNPPIFSGGITVGLNTYDSINSMIDAHFDRLNLGQIAKAFAASVPIPAEVTNTLSNATLSDVQLTVVPNPSGVVLFDKTYEPGFLVKGDANIQDFKLSLLVCVAADGMEARGAISPIRYEPFFALTSADGQAGPSVNFMVKPGNFHMSFTGSATLLGITQSAEMNLRDTGFELMTSGKILNMFNATLRVYGSSVKDGGSFGVNAKLQNDLWQYINQHASEEIDKATKDTQNGINSAKKTITQEQNKLNSLNADIDQQRRIVQSERDRDCKRLADAKADVESKRQSVQSIQNDIDAQHRIIAQIDKRISDKNKWVDSAPNIFEKGTRGTASLPFYTEQAALRSAAMAQIALFETGKATANATLLATREIVGAMGDLCKQTPIDADPRVAGLIAAKGTAQGSMEAAKQILEGAKIVTVGSFQAGKWIVENGSPLGVIVINSAEFDGKLSMVNGGRVSLKVKGSFAGNPLDTSFSFDFKNPLETVNAFADSLLK